MSKVVAETNAGVRFIINDEGKASLWMEGYQIRQAFKEGKFNPYFEKWGISNDYEEDDLQAIEYWLKFILKELRNESTNTQVNFARDIFQRFEEVNLSPQEKSDFRDALGHDEQPYRYYLDVLLISMYVGEVICENFSSARWRDLDSEKSWDARINWMMFHAMEPVYELEITGAKGEKVALNPLSFVLQLIQDNSTDITSILSTITNLTSTTSVEKTVIENDLKILRLAGLDGALFYEEDIEKIEDYILSWESKNTEISFAMLWRLASHIWAIMQQEFPNAYSFRTGEVTSVSFNHYSREEINIASSDSAAIMRFRQLRKESGLEGVLLAVDEHGDDCLVFNPMQKLMYFYMTKKKGYLVDWYQKCKGLFAV